MSPDDKTTLPRDPFTESPISTIQFNHHAFATDERYKIDVAYKVGEVLAYVGEVCGVELAKKVVSLSGLANYVSYK